MLLQGLPLIAGERGIMHSNNTASHQNSAFPTDWSNELVRRHVSMTNTNGSGMFQAQQLLQRHYQYGSVSTSAELFRSSLESYSGQVLAPINPFSISHQQQQYRSPPPSLSHMFPSLQQLMNAQHVMNPIKGASCFAAAANRGCSSAANRGCSSASCAPLAVSSMFASSSFTTAAAVNASPSRKRAVSSSDDDTSSASSIIASVPDRHKKEKLDTGVSEMVRGPTAEDNSEMGLGGESRLKIAFSNLGQPGEHPQVFGKSRLGVPDGLSGSYILYSERWQSEIVHEKNSSFEGDDGTRHVLITWKITNLTSGIAQSRTETPKEAVLRHKDGRTLCNKVFRRALEQRATDLEAELLQETNQIRAKSMHNLIKKLRPKHFSEGPLVFGLRHESVQNRFKTMIVVDVESVLRKRIA